MSGATSEPVSGSTQPSFSYVVLGATSGRQPQDLLRDYLAMDWVRGTPTATARSHDGQAINSAALPSMSAAEAPPQLILQNPPARVPKNALALLRASAPQVLARAAKLPLLSGEKVAAGSLGVLDVAWKGFPAGSIVYTRTSDDGTIAFVLHGYSVDPATGVISRVSAAAKPANMAALAMATSAIKLDPTITTIIDSALTIAEFAGFALGPAGVVLSAAAAVILQIFNQCMSPSQVDLSQIVADAVRSVQTDLQVENADATIGVDFDWLRDHYNASWADGAKVSDDDCQQFKSELEGKLDADTGIVQTVALLKEPDYQEKGFVLFLLGAGIVLLMLKIAVILESSAKQVVDTFQFAALMDKLGEYISAGDAGLRKIDGDIAARLGQITEPQRASQTLMNPGSGSVSVTYYWWWQDTGDGSPEQDYPDTATGGCNSTMVQHQDQAQSDRDAHYTQVLAQLNSQYYAGDPDKAHATVQKWKDMQAEFAQYAPAKT